MMHHKPITIFLLLVFFSSQVLSQEELTLEEAIATGLDKNYSIRIADKNYEIDQNNNTIGNAGFLPVIDLSAGKVYQSQDVDLEIQGAEGTFNVSRDGAKSDRFNADAQLSWTIFDGLGMFITKDKLEEFEIAGELSFRIALENTVAAVQSAYYRVVVEQARYGVLEQTLELSAQRTEFSQSRYEIGKGSKIDYLSAQVDYNSDQTDLIVQREVLQMARVDLNVLMGQDPELNYVAIDTFTINDQLLYEDVKEKIVSLNPQLLFAINEQNIAYSEYKEFVSLRYPTIDLDVAYGYGTSNNDAGQLRSSQTQGWTYGLSASWNIFDGFNKNRQIQNARIRRETTMLQKEEIELQLLGDLRKRYSNYVNSIELVGLEKENVEVAIENEEIAIDRYKLGVGTFLELREAQQNNVDAQTRLLNAQLVAKLAEIELLRLSGNILGEQGGYQIGR